MDQEKKWYIIFYRKEMSPEEVRAAVLENMRCIRKEKAIYAAIFEKESQAQMFERAGMPATLFSNNN